MKGKGVIQFFAVALLLVSIYQLSFNLVTNRIENRAEEQAQRSVLRGNPMPANPAARDSVNSLIKRQYASYIDSIANEPVYPVFGFTYLRCKEQQLNLGLDLQGGMNVVLQVSMRDLIKSLADNSEDAAFNKALDMADKKQESESQKDYVTLFIESYKESNPTGKLASIFATKDNADRIKYNSTDEEVEKVIRTEAENAFDRTFNILRSRIDKFGVTQPNITAQPSTGRVTVELPGVDNAARVRRLLQASAKLEFWETYIASEIYPAFENVNKVLAQRLQPADTSAAATVDPLLSSTDTSATTNDTAADPLTGSPSLANNQTTPKDTAAEMAKVRAENPLFALLVVPNYKDEADGQQKVSQGPEVGFVLGKDTAKINEYLNYDFVRATLPRNIKFAWSAKPFTGTKNTYALYALRKQGNSDEPPLDGSAIVTARHDINQRNDVEVSMSMNQDGAKIWRLLTQKQVGKYGVDPSGRSLNGYIAIVLDDQVQSSPRVNEEIPNGRSSITGNFTQEEAKDLANILQTGKLPAPAVIIAEEVVGPTLGAESVRAGIRSMIFAFLAILAFMVLYYSTSGLIANMALIINLLFIFGVLASISATLTLAGIAGIVLTMGMAVDANVIIHERIKEELSKGAALTKAIHDGHTKSYSAIFDSNVTTLITGLILIYFGMGPVLGYATTLNIGILMTLFTAVFIAHMLMDWWIKRGGKMQFSTKFAPNLTNYNIDFVKMRKASYIISGVLTIVAIVAIIGKGFEYGVDFTGGRTYVVQMEKKIPTEEVRQSLAQAFDGNAPVVKTYGTNNQVKITTSYLIHDEGADAAARTDAALFNGLKSYYSPDVTFDRFIDHYKLSSSIVGPTISDDVRDSAYRAIFFAVIAIGLYILLRFRRWQYSMGALLALVHDTLMVLGLFSIFSNLLPFTLEVDEQFVAAILTVMGYSLNDTVIIFDRIREYRKEHPGTPLKQVINDAINSTLNRTVTTHVTTLIVLFVLFAFAGEAVRGFTFAMIVGVLVGTYSSIFVAAPVMLDLSKDELNNTAATEKKGTVMPKPSVAKS